MSLNKRRRRLIGRLQATRALEDTGIRVIKTPSFAFFRTQAEAEAFKIEGLKGINLKKPNPLGTRLGVSIPELQ